MPADQSTASTVLIGVVAGVVTQLLTLLTLLMKDRSRRAREDAAARLVDARAARDRQWMIEDRIALAKRMQSAAATTTAAARAHAEASAAGVGELKQMIQENTGLTRQVGEAAAEALTEANGTKALLVDEVRTRNQIAAALANRPHNERHDDPKQE